MFRRFASLVKHGDSVLGLPLALSISTLMLSSTSVRCRAASKNPLTQVAASVSGVETPTPRKKTSKSKERLKRKPRFSESHDESVDVRCSRGRPVSICREVYYVEDDLNGDYMAEEQLKDERLSIAKLLIISQSLGSVFSSVPGRKTVEEYVSSVDSAKAFGKLDQRSSKVSSAFLSERVLVEERADHVFSIHVRDMEQLVPPEHLSGDEKSFKKGKKPKLDPLERLKALHQWRMEALKQSHKSLELYAVPNNVHAITRLRLYNPAKVDVTVVQSCGCPKKPDDVLAALYRYTKGDQGEWSVSQEEEEVMKAIFLAAFTQQSGEERNESMTTLAASGLVSPFALRPLITVYASCLPRRESVLGEPTPAKCSSASSSTVEGKSEGAPAKAKDYFYEDVLGRHIPGVPQHTTRLTLLVEHNELEVADLVSLAEITRVRTEDTPSSRKSTKTFQTYPHIYCLIADGSAV